MSASASPVGVIVAAGDAYLAVVHGVDGSMTAAVMKLELAAQMPLARALIDLGARVAQEFRRIGPSRIVIVEPKPRLRGWSYTDAFRKASVETMVMTAAAEGGVTVEQMKPSRIMKALELPKEEPEAILKKRLTNAPKYWSTAWLAVGAAMVARSRG